MNRQLADVVMAIDRLVVESRLRDLALVAQTDRVDRVSAVAAILSKLPPGGYLIGCGPYCCGILPLTVDEVILGRPPLPVERMPGSVVDYTANDAVWMLPREVSKVHASVIRRTIQGKATYWVRDKESRTGTYVNGHRVTSDEESAGAPTEVELSNGDIVSLGPSGVNVYVFFVTK